MRKVFLLTGLLSSGCGVLGDLKTSDDRDDDDGEWAGESTGGWSGGSGGGTGGAAGGTGGGSGGSGGSGGGSGGSGGGSGGSDGGGSGGSVGGGGSDTDSDTDSSSGDGVFNVDQLYVFWDGVFRDGEPEPSALFTNSDGEVESLDTSFQFVWIDSTDYSEGNEDYLCSLVYDNQSASEGDFTDIEGAADAYMTYQLDLGAMTPESRGNCDGAAAHFGVASMEEVVQSQPWGYGYGRMTDDFEDELSGAMDDYSSLGDTAGVSYLRWRAGEDDMFTAWGYFQVIPFESDESDMVITIEDPSQLVGGVRDSDEPVDGYYMQETVYTITYGG